MMVKVFFYFLAVAALLVYAAFVIRTAAHLAGWLKGPSAEKPGRGQPLGGGGAGAAALDVIFLRRLFRVNKVLWLGEWVFHASLVLVLIRHLRYFLTPVPQFVWQMQAAGRAAGYVLPFSLLYIFAVKAAANRGRQMFAYNYVLLSGFFIISSLGALLSLYFYPNVVAVKEFMMFALDPKALLSGAVPGGVLAGFHGEAPFLAHFILALCLLLYLPSHIFAAPFTIYQARRREESVKGGFFSPAP